MSLASDTAWLISQLSQGKRVQHPNGTYCYPNVRMGKIVGYCVRLPSGKVYPFDASGLERAASFAAIYCQPREKV